MVESLIKNKEIGMENIFENAKFGDKFITRDGTVAIYIALHEEHSIYNDNVTIEHTYALPNRCTVHWCKDDGTNLNYQTDWDIISRYQEPIDENKLEELADDYCKDKLFDEEFEYIRVNNSFKAGYRKAKEE